LSELKKILLSNSFPASEKQIQLLQDYCVLLLDWNKKINLISRKDEENILTRHIISSISFLFKFQLGQGCTIADVGTGGGLPGIPLGILLQDAQVVLIDSIQKKILAVQEIIQQMKLKNISTLHGRAEELARETKFQHSFDYVIARAVGSVSNMIQWCKPLLKQTNNESPSNNQLLSAKEVVQAGSLILLKGGDLSQEIEQAKVKTRPYHIEVHSLPVNGVGHSILDDKKIVIIQP
jgi:16S rRNA (guanine527-N7)-methyltransferase